MTAFAPEHYRQNVFVPEGACAGPLPAPWLRKARLVCGVARLVTGLTAGGLWISGVALEREPLMIAAVVLAVPSYAAIFAETLLALVWLYRMWAWFPPGERHTKLWNKYISPNMAVALMFVPYFSIYWMFVVYLGMADVFDRLRASYPTSRESPRKLAMVALIGSMVFFPAAPILHYLLDSRIEGLAREIQPRMGRPIA